MRFRTVRFKRILCAILSGAMIMASVSPAFAATARATTMKLEKTEGTVTLKTQNGSARKITKGMRLYNGNTLETAKYSYAHISLDGTKAVKLDQSSSATLRQGGKQLELLVKSGKLFFNVSQPLGEKENMNIRTSTMVTGIRGTCGIVEYVNANKSKLYLLEGKVTLGTGKNATTVYGGQTATVILQPKKQSGGSDQPGGEDKPGESGETDQTDKEMEQKVMVETLTEEIVPVFAIEEILSDPVLQEKIEQTTELEMEKLEEVLEESQQETETEKEEEEKKEETTSSGGGSYTPSTPAPTSATLSGTVSAAAINAALASYDKVTVVAVGKDADGNQVETSVTLEDNVAVPAGKVLIMETGKVENGMNLSCGEGTLIDCGNVSGITDSTLLSITGDASVYAKEFYPQVADYLNEYAQKSLSVSVDFKKNAIVKSNITLQPASGTQQLIQLNMSGNTLEIQSGTLTLASDVSILGSSSNALVLLSGGNLILQGISNNGNVNIQNTGSGATISRTAGTVTWNDTGLGIANKNGAELAIDGASASDDMVKIPDWIKIKTGYAAVWKDNMNMLSLEPTQSDFTSGTVTLADLNRALSANQTVTIGADANVTLQAQEYLTIPSGKTLIVQSKINGNESTGYTYGFEMESGSVLTVDDKATLKVSGAIGLNGTLNVGSNEGATLLVDSGALLQVDEINLTNRSTLTNNGTIDGGTLSLEGSGTIENHALIKMKTCKAIGDSNTSYSYVDVNGDSILVADGYGFSNDLFTGISRLACVMASTGSTDENNLFEPLVSVYANRLNQLAANQMRGNRMIDGKQVVQVNVSKNVDVMDDITWDLAGAGVGMADFKVNVAAGKALTLKNINSFGGTGDTLIEVGSGATLTITEDGSITDRSPHINLGPATGSAISVADGAKVSLQDPGLVISVENTADHIISGMQVINENVIVPNCVETLAEYTCIVEYSDEYSELLLVKDTGV